MSQDKTMICPLCGREFIPPKDGTICGDCEIIQQGRDGGIAMVYRTRALLRKVQSDSVTRYTGRKNMVIVCSKVLWGSFAKGDKITVAHGSKTYTYTIASFLTWNGSERGGVGSEIASVSRGDTFCFVISDSSVMLFPDDIVKS
ncbi:MAG: hypothetical protein II695_04965 [Oscillospiraceae bacterium]|nr:hypothetical protein [Oscillospiraceae bacterium]